MTTAIAFESRLRSFKENNRGAIMVLGIFFACVMIGWMWMLVGLGDAMIWRDRSQEAADAISYSSAAIQAKGMNIISFINIVMLIIAGIYVVLAAAYNFLDLIHVLLGSENDGFSLLFFSTPSSCKVRATDSEIVGTALDLVGLEVLGAIFNELGSYWCKAAKIIRIIHDKAGKVLGKYETLMTDVLPPLSTFEDIVSYGSPWAGEAVGTYMGSKYVDWNQTRTGIPVSATLIPATMTPGKAGWFPAKKYKAETCESASDPSQCKEYDGGDKREGLPVEIPDDGMGRLCKAAATEVLSPIVGFVKNIPLVGWLLSSLVNQFAKGVEDSFCMQKSTGMFDGTEDFVTEWFLQLPTAIQSGGWNNNETCPHGNWGVDNGGGGNGDLGDGGPGTCNGVYQIKKGSKPFWQNPIDIGGPHTVVEYANNGSDWMQVWSFLFGGNRPEQSEKKVAVAGMDGSGPNKTWDQIIPQNSDTAFTMYLAQSEFYFDCDDKWTEAKCNDNNNASFQMSWRARLRRVRGLSWKNDLFQYLVGGSLGDAFDDRALKWIQGGEQSGLQTITSKFGQFIGNTLLSGAFKFVKDSAVDTIGGAINPASALPEVIH
jgi:hypothetical protein